MQCSLLKKIGLQQNHVTKYFVATTHLFHTASLSLVIVLAVVVVVLVVVVVVVVVKISIFPAPKATHCFQNSDDGCYACDFFLPKSLEESHEV